MRNRGLCIVNRLPVFRTHRPNVRTTAAVWWEGERRLTRTRHQTPVGDLFTPTEDGDFTTWRHELLLKTPKDYAAIRCSPAPDTDMTLAEARTAGPDKVLWINFPFSVHLRSDAAVADTACALVTEAGRPEGLLRGITENMPAGRWPDSCRAIMDGLDRHARENPTYYRAAERVAPA